MLTVHLSQHFLFNTSREIFILVNYQTQTCSSAICQQRSAPDEEYIHNPQKATVTCIMRQSLPWNFKITSNATKGVDQCTCITEFFMVTMLDWCLTIAGDNLISSTLISNIRLADYVQPLIEHLRQGTCHLRCWDHCSQR